MRYNVKLYIYIYKSFRTEKFSWNFEMEDIPRPSFIEIEK